MASVRSRGLSPEFMDDLLDGMLSPLLELVKADDTLSLNIRDDYINVYYRGRSLAMVKHRPPHSYSFSFDANYLKSQAISLMGIGPGTVKTAGPWKFVADVMDWLADVPSFKIIVDSWLGENPRLERELQQMVERMNNSNHATDYFVCDVEYTNTRCTELQADLIGVHWPSKTAARKDRSCPRLVVMEMKHQETAIAGKCGLLAHIQDLRSMAIPFQELADEMLTVFNQRVELGLIQCHSDKILKHKIECMNGEHPLYLILLSDHDPDSSRLLIELNNIPDPVTLPFDLKVVSANMMGYGLFDQGMYSLEEFKQKCRKRIYSKEPPADATGSVTPLEEVS